MKYKITTSNPEFVGNEFNGLKFVGVAYTDSKEKANSFANSGYQTEGKPLFTVEEVTE